MDKDTAQIYDYLQEISWHFANQGLNGECCGELSPVDFMALKKICEMRNPSIQEIGIVLNFTKSGATRVVNRLESKGYAARKQSPEDGRICCVAATNKGIEAVSGIIQKNVAYLNERLRCLEPRMLLNIKNGLELLAKQFIHNESSCESDEFIKQGDMNMKTLTIEWKHLDVEGETCNRCYDTGENLNQEVKRLNRTLQPKGIAVTWYETKLDDTQIPQSNTILFNGVPIEDILDIEVSENYCDSCTALLGNETYCRTIKYEGEEYEDIPAKAIRQAAYKVLGISEKAPAENAGCGCNCGGCC